MPISFETPETVLRDIAAQAKARRLAANLTRQTLAERSGVSLASIKRFETTGHISLYSLLQLAFVLDCLDACKPLFAAKPPQTLADLQTKPRQRGRL